MQLEKEAGFIKNVALGLVILVAVFFIFRSFYGNPIKGTWENKDTGIMLQVKDNETATLTWRDSEEKVILPYELGKKEKDIVFMRNAGTMDTLDAGTISEEHEKEVEALIDAFSYSVEGKKLILIQKDFGDQIVLTKMK